VVPFQRSYAGVGPRLRSRRSSAARVTATDPRLYPTVNSYGMARLKERHHRVNSTEYSHDSIPKDYTIKAFAYSGWPMALRP
jgi:hypothetical protein